MKCLPFGTCNDRVSSKATESTSDDGGTNERRLFFLAGGEGMVSKAERMLSS